MQKGPDNPWSSSAIPRPAHSRQDLPVRTVLSVDLEKPKGAVAA
jgi:hypothetical protein